MGHGHRKTLGRDRDRPIGTAIEHFVGSEGASGRLGRAARRDLLRRVRSQAPPQTSVAGVLRGCAISPSFSRPARSVCERRRGAVQLQHAPQTSDNTCTPKAQAREQAVKSRLGDALSTAHGTYLEATFVLQVHGHEGARRRRERHHKSEQRHHDDPAKGGWEACGHPHPQSSHRASGARGCDWKTCTSSGLSTKPKRPMALGVVLILAFSEKPRHERGNVGLVARGRLAKARRTKTEVCASARVRASRRRGDAGQTGHTAKDILTRGRASGW